MEEKFMILAIEKAKKAKNDVPVGAVIVKNGQVISWGYNKKDKLKNCLAHAEMIAINKAQKRLKDFRLNNCEMYVTFEPCIMCVGAILSARIKHVYFGAFDKRYSASELLEKNNFNHKTTYTGGICEQKCKELLTCFFSKIRNK